MCFCLIRMFGVAARQRSQALVFWLRVEGCSCAAQNELQWRRVVLIQLALRAAATTVVLARDARADSHTLTTFLRSRGWQDVGPQGPPNLFGLLALHLTAHRYLRDKVWHQRQA